MTRRARISKPPARLALLVEQPGGVPRSVAVAQATRRIEAQREPARQAMADMIGRLEAMVQPDMPVKQLIQIGRAADRLINLALTYECTALAQAAQRLCDLVARFAADGGSHHASLVVHVRALKLLQAGKGDASGVMEELDRVLAHFGVGRAPN